MLICSHFLGSYQIRMAKSYIREHLSSSENTEEKMQFIVELCKEHEDLIRARFQSRHSNRKRHVATVQFNGEEEQPIQGWYCTCSSGAREVGMCSHVTALLWHMGVERTRNTTFVNPLGAANLLNAIDDSISFSDDETDSDSDNESSFTSATTTEENNTTDDDSDW